MPEIAAASPPFIVLIVSRARLARTDPKSVTAALPATAPEPGMTCAP